MARPEGEKTKRKILVTAEKLFSENGFDGTSISMITKTAGVNKALVYYHFKDKNDIIEHLCQKIVEELRHDLENSIQKGLVHPNDTKATILEEIKSVLNRRKIVSVMLMESLKSNNKNNYFLKIANIIVNGVLNDREGQSEDLSPEERLKRQHKFVHEFFTGFMPVIAYVVLKDKICDYFNFDSDILLEQFMDSLERSHIASHM